MTYLASWQIYKVEDEVEDEDEDEDEIFEN